MRSIGRDEEVGSSDIVNKSTATFEERGKVGIACDSVAWIGDFSSSDELNDLGFRGWYTIDQQGRRVDRVNDLGIIQD